MEIPHTSYKLHFFPPFPPSGYQRSHPSDCSRVGIHVYTLVEMKVPEGFFGTTFGSLKDLSVDGSL